MLASDVATAVQECGFTVTQVTSRQVIAHHVGAEVKLYANRRQDGAWNVSAMAPVHLGNVEAVFRDLVRLIELLHALYGAETLRRSARR